MTEEMNTEMASVQVIQPGDTLKGKVVKVEDKVALVDIGYKNEGILTIGEVSNVHIDKVSDVLQEGDEIDVRVLRINEEEDKVFLSKRAVDRERAWEDLQRKFETGEVFEATVANVVKGGLVVDVGVRGFIPASMVERHFVEDFSDYKGRTLTLKVVELDKEQNKVILSHRAVLEDELNKKKQELFQRLKPGDVVEGRVQRLTDFGAFVDLGGVDGLVHVSEIAWHHVEKPSDVLKEGDTVKVKILNVDPENERISLSIKETVPGPWDEAKERFSVGQIVEGTVKRLVPFGAFVELMPGVEGLVHISQISRRHIGTPEEELQEGQKVKVKILDLNFEAQRISLSIKEAQEAPKAPKSTPAEQHTGLNITLGEVIGDQLRQLKP
ncbi:MAG: 30S ribosomal protein S1 [Bacillaceae bacterium G1]|nr:30S ribosomal protein S1 [Bacillota bacterium]OJF16734.1 MAG: 30S ribosomal protein S1 [Bacillaceae bacterium G1]